MYRDGTNGRSEEASQARGEERSAGAVYRELLPIGSGGSANISIAIAEGIAGFNKLVVLKTIREELIANSAAKKMFLDEARLSARMNHPNVVQVYEVFLRQEVPVIVMEFLDGQPLSSILAQAYDSKSLTLEVAISILSKALAGLHYAHTLTDFTGQPLGLIHRDVSPHNVMVTYDGQVKLVDFGIAKLAGADHNTRTGVIKGKLTYMAPEQFTGKVDCRSDIFGVGVMLWELANRQRFWGDLAEPVLIGRLISGDLPHLRGPGGMDEELYQICSRALAFSVEERYPTAAAMQEDLERYLAKRGAVVSQAAIGRLVTETCAEARRKVQSGIRDQLSRHGLSLTGSVDGLPLERVRPKADHRDASGERIRKTPLRDTGLSSAKARAAGEQTTTGGLRSKNGAEQTTTGGLRKKGALEQTTTGGLRNKAAEPTRTGGGAGEPARRGAGVSSHQGLDQTTTGGLRQKPAATPSGGARPEGTVSAAAPADPAAAAAPGAEAPVRLIGGVSPTARVGVALAGFGTLGVLILALGLATPQQPVALTPVSSTAQINANAAPGPQQRRQVRIKAAAQPAEAVWYLDDQKLDSNPAEITMPTDGAVHTLRAEAKGFDTFVQSVRFDADVDVSIALTPAK